MGDKQNVALALIYIGDLLLAGDEVEAARAHYVEAIPLCREVDERIVATHAVQGLASLARVQGQSERAIQLLGCVQAQRTRMGIVLSPEERAGIDQALAQMRDAVGESRFEQAWQAGSALDMEAIFADTLTL